ncbi:hypothetical protein ACLOJK_036750 [Asimina triloba]
MEKDDAAVRCYARHAVRRPASPSAAAVRDEGEGVSSLAVDFGLRSHRIGVRGRAVDQFDDSDRPSSASAAVFSAGSEEEDGFPLKRRPRHFPRVGLPN